MTTRAIIDPVFFRRGAVVTGRVPTSIIDMSGTGTLTPSQQQNLVKQYKVFCDLMDKSVLVTHSLNRVLSDGSMIRFERIQDNDTILVWPPEPKGRDKEIQHDWYMESGTLSFSWPGDENPTRADPATWKLIDISPTPVLYKDMPMGDDEARALYLGEVYSVLEVVKKGASSFRIPIDYKGVTFAEQTKKQRTKRPIVDGMDSWAIGYEHKADPGEEQEEKEKWADKTVLKKMVVSCFPASSFSGRLRQFVSAQYGGKYDNPSWHFTLRVLGNEILLLYENDPTPDDEFDEDSVQFGFWIYNSSGIYISPDGLFWFINIRGEEDRLVMYAYKMKYDTPTARAVSKVYQAYKKDPNDPKIKLGHPITARAIHKLETYLMAHMSIDIGSKTQIGNSQPRPEGYGTSFAYGWKFNKDGTQARIISHSVEGVVGDIHIKALDIKFDLTYTPVQNEKPAPEWISAACTADIAGEWMDGWGDNNIFVPEYYHGGRLTLWSVRMSFWPSDIGKLRPTWDHGPVPIYGYYRQAGDETEWIEVTVHRTTTPPKSSYKSSGIYYPPYIDPTRLDAWNWGSARISDPWQYETDTLGQGRPFVLTIDDFSHSATRVYGSWSKNYYSSEQDGPDNWPNGANSYIPAYIGAWGLGMEDPSMTAYNSAPVGTYNYPTWPVPHATTFPAKDTYTTESADITDEAFWVLCLPIYDAESVVVYTKENRNYDQYRRQVVILGNGWPVHHYAAHAVGPTGDGSVLEVWNYGDIVKPGITPGGAYVSNTTYFNNPYVPPPTKVYMWNKFVSAVEGTPGANTGALFSVSILYPFYDPGLYVVTGVQRWHPRYATTISIKNPANIAAVNQIPRLVGWA